MTTHNGDLYALISKTIEEYNKEHGTSFSSEIGALGEAFPKRESHLPSDDIEVLKSQATKIQKHIKYYTTAGNQAEVQYLTIELNNLYVRIDQLALASSLQTELDSHIESSSVPSKYREVSTPNEPKMIYAHCYT